MQIFYLSNRPAVLADTLSAVAHRMPWISSVVVVGPSGMSFFPPPELPLTVLDECEVTGMSSAQLASLDHVSRNVLLRRSALDQLDDQFILSDDDYRPLVPVGLDNFIGPQGRYRRYWFYHLEDWPGWRTDFDLAQIRTLAALRLLGAPSLAYGSHMPQIIDKVMLNEVFKQAREVGSGDLVDEWSLYFNLAAQNNPEAFAEPEPFQTLAWPQWPHEWPLQVTANPIKFENYYPEHDAFGGLFHGLPPTSHPEAAIARIEAWRKAELAISELRFAPEWNDPWRANHPVRRRMFDCLRIVSKAQKYSSLGR